MAEIEYRKYYFIPPENEDYMSPESPLKKHPLGFLILLAIIVFGGMCLYVGVISDWDFDYEDVLTDNIELDDGSFLSSILIILIFSLMMGFAFAVISGSLFSAASYSYYYLRCFLYNTTLRIKNSRKKQ
tara:strand:- start:2790 stop:3176 length:387 start_codon:yes stop_codon:yes gene_type:complete